MKEFDNVEMMEEELDNVAGAQKAATIKHLEDGDISVLNEEAKANMEPFRAPSDAELRWMDRYPGVIFY